MPPSRVGGLRTPPVLGSPAPTGHLTPVFLGLDLTDVDRLARSVARSGVDFLRQFLTPAELDACSADPHPHRTAAAHFAAKEALSKALGTGVYGTFSFHDVEIRGDLRRNPTIHLSGRAKEVADTLGVTAVHLSLASDPALAMALVVLE